MQALARAYPTRITSVEVRDRQWAIEMDGIWYYWAAGRLLPEEQRAQFEEYVSIRFYNYELGPIVLPEIDPSIAERLRERTTNARTDGRLRFNGFLDSLYGISSRDEAEQTTQAIFLLGLETRVHPLLVDPLNRVDARIRTQFPSSKPVREFVETLEAADAYNWRNIAGTQRRSYHSYGVAIDLVPKYYGGKWPYWLWASQSGVTEWWTIPLEERWLVPQPIVDAFEAEGFIWGGKWMLFDALHFEYRPESILMASGS